jgi:hypothetical protein
LRACISSVTILSFFRCAERPLPEHGVRDRCQDDHNVPDDVESPVPDGTDMLPEPLIVPVADVDEL